MTSDYALHQDDSALNTIILNPVYQFWNDYSNYIRFSVPFLCFRALTPFKAGETLTKQIVEGAALASIAAVVEYGVTHNQLQDYKWSVLPVIGSFLYNKNPLDSNKIGSMSVAFGGVTLVNSLWDSGNLPYAIMPLISYTFCRINNIDKQQATVFSSTAATFDYLIAHHDIVNRANLNYVLSGDQHVFNWALAGFAFSNNLARHFASEEYTASISTAGMAIGAILSQYERVVLDQLFTPSHFKQTYSVVEKFVDKNEFDLILQQNIIASTAMQICMGFFGNHLLIGSQMVKNSLVSIGKVEDKTEKIKAYGDFLRTVSTFMAKYLAPYMVIKMPHELLISYNFRQINNFVEQQVIEKNLLVKDKFITSSKSNYTIQSYLKDTNILSEDLKTIQWSVFSLPKIVQLNNINLPIAVGLGAIALSDVMIKKFFTFLSNQKQAYEDKKIKCESSFERFAAYDKEYAVTISQKSGLNQTLTVWEALQQCKNDNLLIETLYSRLVDVGQFFYGNDILYTCLHALVGYLISQGTVTIEELWLYTRSLEMTSDAILFKSKNVISHKKVESAAARLEELAKLLNSKQNTIAKLQYKVDSNSNELDVFELDFTRGNQEQQAHIHVKQLKLLLGNIYAVTGDNGSGKSSFTTLLKYVLDGIADPSFNCKRGEITYPDDSIMMVPQKDYIKHQSSLIDLILYPDMSSNLSESQENEIVTFINNLQVFVSPITSNELYQVKEDWQDLSGGQKKKLFMVKAFFECPKVLIMDETFGPLDPNSRGVLMSQIEKSCLSESLVLIVWHKDKNEDGTSCVKEPFFDYELHVQNETLVLGKVGVDCLY